MEIYLCSHVHDDIPERISFIRRWPSNIITFIGSWPSKIIASSLQLYADVTTRGNQVVHVYLIFHVKTCSLIIKAYNVPQVHAKKPNGYSNIPMLHKGMLD